MNERMFSLWVYLSETPLLWLAATIGIFVVAQRISRWLGGSALLNPVLLAVVALVAILQLTRTPYETYFEGAQFVHFLLGPATVALAIPLYLASNKLRQVLFPALIALVVGSATGIASAVLVAQALGLSPLTTLSLAPKSITSPIAMGISAQIGGLPSLTAVLVISTGMIGALLGNEVLSRLRITDESTRGFALGLAAHGLGTARALQISPEMGAFAGLAMGLNGAMTALLTPLLLDWLR